MTAATRDSALKELWDRVQGISAGSSHPGAREDKDGGVTCSQVSLSVQAPALDCSAVKTSDARDTWSVVH